MHAPFAFVLVALLAVPGDTLPAPTASPVPERSGLDDLRSALESAVARAGRFGLLPAARAAGRVYRLKGYGAMIVLAPRALPARRIVVRRGGAPAALDLGDLEWELEAQMAAQAEWLLDLESAEREWSRAHERELRKHLRLVEEQAEAFRVEAERARRRAEREVRIRLAPPAPPIPAAPAGVSVPPVPAAPMPPIAPPAPEAGEAPEAPLPPWRFRFDVSPDADRTETVEAESVVAAVREGLVSGLESYPRRLASLRPDEFVAVAVDFLPGRLLRGRPTRTLLVRVRARDLHERQAGRLSAVEFRQRIEFDED